MRTEQQQRSAASDDVAGSSEATPGLSVIVPTYNERANITLLVERAMVALAEYDFELVVVDDDSPDGTADAVRSAYGDDDRVRVIQRTVDPGLAQAVTRGFREASFEYCAVIDADLQHPPEKLSALYEQLDDGADVAIGSRHVVGGGIENWSTYRKLVSRGATALTRVAVRGVTATSDPMSGFFAIRRSVVEDVELDPQGYKILLEVLAKGDFETVSEVPYVFRERERGESNLTAAEYVNFLEHLGQLAVDSRGLHRYVEPRRAVRGFEFAVVGAIGTILNTLVFGLAHLEFGLHYVLAGFLAFLVAVNWNFAGNWLVTFDDASTNVARKYAKFHAVSVVGLGFYTAFLLLFIGALDAPALLGNVGAILASSVFNFEGSERFAFAA